MRFSGCSTWFRPQFEKLRSEDFLFYRARYDLTMHCQARETSQEKIVRSKPNRPARKLREQNLANNEG